MNQYPLTCTDIAGKQRIRYCASMAFHKRHSQWRGRRSGLGSIIAWTEFHREAPYDPEAQQEESESGNVLPSDVLFPVEFDDQFPNHKDNGRIDHCAQTETVHLEIGDKPPEQFDDHEKCQDIDNYDVERLADRPLEKKFLYFIDRLEKTDNKHDNYEQGQDNHDPLKGLAEYYL